MTGCRGRTLLQSAIRGVVIVGEMGAGAEGAKPVSFIRDIAPVFVKQCQGCHGPEKSKGKYRLDSFERLMKAGESKDAPVAAGRAGGGGAFLVVFTKEGGEGRAGEA